MKLLAAWAKQICWAATIFVASPDLLAQQRPLTRHFVAPTEERYQVTLNLKAESHSVATETVAAQTYVTPVVHIAEVKARWSAVRKIFSLQNDGSATIEETVTPGLQHCEEMTQLSDKTDTALQESLKAFCAFWLKTGITRYLEDNRGVLRQAAASASGNALPPLAETSPQLLSLWLKRAVRPNVMLPQLELTIGATSQQSFQPASSLLKNARGSETTEWLDSQSEVPAATLHVVQQLLWSSAGLATPGTEKTTLSPGQKEEAFFADSLSTLSLQDGSLLRANRSASRTTTRHVDPVPGLPQPPDFSSKLTLTVTIERLP
jgi:hypothetical protein